MKDLQLRPMTEGDLVAADGLRELAGWNQTLEDWRRILKLSREGCFVAERGGSVVGTVTTTCHGVSLAWIGMMLVHPEHRGQGIGGRLMRQAVDWLSLRKIRSIKLDATPAGQPVYEKLGFVPESYLSRWQRASAGGSAGATPPSPTTCAITDPDWPSVLELDYRAFGAERGALLRSLGEGSRASLLDQDQETVTAWGMVRPGRHSDYLGPVVARDAAAAGGLISELLRQARPGPVVWDIPNQNTAARELAREHGFALVRPFCRMRLGPDVVRHDLTAQFAIADPGLG